MTRLFGFQFSLRHQLLCSALAFAVLSPFSSAQAEGGVSTYTATLQNILQTDPGHFNERMWAVIRANPEAREQILHDAIRLSFQHELARDPSQQAATLARFKQLYPQMAAEFDAAVAGVEAAPLPQVTSVLPPKTIRPYADDPTTRTAAHTTWMGRNWPWVLLGGVAVGGATAGIIAATSSSGSSTPERTLLPSPPTVGAQQEYDNQSGLARINAGAINNAGYTGSGVTVAVVDTGLNTDHPDLRDNVASGGYDFINGTSLVTDTDSTNFHGTHVAGVIAAEKNDFGMRGVAYDAKILPFAAIGSSAPLTAVRDSVNAASAAGAKVMNASYGPGSAAVGLFVSNGAQFLWDEALTEADAYLNAANHGMVLVFAAGNSYSVGNATIAAHPMGGGFLPFIKPANSAIALGSPGAYRYSNDGVTLTTLNADYSALEGKLLAVVAVDENNVIASFSNRCGVAKAWCLAAPGTNIYSTGTGNSYSALDGTSFAAPHVSGALAVLMQLHPELTPTQVVNLLLSTATDLGTAGIDDIYGNGLVNLQAALLATGPFSIVTSSNMNGSSFLLSSSSIHSAPAFGNNVANALAATEVGVLDATTRNFTVTLGQQVTTRLTQLDATTALRRFAQNEFRPTIALDDVNSVSFTAKPKDGLERAASDADQPSSVDSYSFTHQIGEDTAVSVLHRDARANALGFRADDRELLGAQVSSSGVGNPYLDFISDGYASNVTVDIPWEGRFRATTAMGAPEDDEGQRNMLTMAEVGFGTNRLGMTLSSGALLEQDRMLGLNGAGAFALGQGTTTWFGGIEGHWQLAEKTQLLASWYGGVTDARADNNSLVQGIDRVSSSAWRLGVMQKDVLQDDDHLRFNMAQPLRAESGALNLSIPQYRLRDGTMIRQNASYALAPSGREVDFEAGYGFALGGSSRIDIAGMLRHDAGHVSGQDEAIGVTRFNSGF